MWVNPVYTGRYRGGAREARPPLCLDQTEARGAEKVFFVTAPLLLLMWRSGCATGMNTWHYHYPCRPFIVLTSCCHFRRLPSLRFLSFSSDSPSIVSFFFVHFTLNIIQYNLRTVEACVAEQSTPRTLVGGSSLARRVVSLDKEVYSTLSLFTQVYKWMPATYCLGVTLRWASMPSRGE